MPKQKQPTPQELYWARKEREEAEKNARLPPGLFNHGNTCFMNSVLQGLIATQYLEELVRFQPLPENVLRAAQTPILSQRSPELTNAHGHGGQHERAHSNEMPLGDTFVALMMKAWGVQEKRQRENMSPKEVLQLLGQKYDQYLDFRQQDAHEFLRQLLDAMRMEEVDVIKKRQSHPPPKIKTSQTSSPGTSSTSELRPLPLSPRPRTPSPLCQVTNSSSAEHGEPSSYFPSQSQSQPVPQPPPPSLPSDASEQQGATDASRNSASSASITTEPTHSPNPPEAEYSAERAKAEEAEKLMPFVDMLFGGRLASILVCQTCKHVSHVYEDFNDLSLSLKPEDYARERKRDKFKQLAKKLKHISGSALGVGSSSATAGNGNASGNATGAADQTASDPPTPALLPMSIPLPIPMSAPRSSSVPATPTRDDVFDNADVVLEGSAPRRKSIDLSVIDVPLGSSDESHQPRLSDTMEVMSVSSPPHSRTGVEGGILFSPPGLGASSERTGGDARVGFDLPNGWATPPRDKDKERKAKDKDKDKDKDDDGWSRLGRRISVSMKRRSRQVQPSKKSRDQDRDAKKGPNSASSTPFLGPQRGEVNTDDEWTQFSPPPASDPAAAIRALADGTWPGAAADGLKSPDMSVRVDPLSVAAVSDRLQAKLSVDAGSAGAQGSGDKSPGGGESTTLPAPSPSGSSTPRFPLLIGRPETPAKHSKRYSDRSGGGIGKYKMSAGEAAYLRDILADVPAPGHVFSLFGRHHHNHHPAPQEGSSNDADTGGKAGAGPTLGLSSAGANLFLKAGGHVSGIEECLRLFTGVEVLDGENKVGCHRCWKIANGSYRPRTRERMDEDSCSDSEEEREREEEKARERAGERTRTKGEEMRAEEKSNAVATPTANGRGASSVDGRSVALTESSRSSSSSSLLATEESGTTVTTGTTPASTPTCAPSKELPTPRQPRIDSAPPSPMPKNLPLPIPTISTTGPDSPASGGPPSELGVGEGPPTARAPTFTRSDTRTSLQSMASASSTSLSAPRVQHGRQRAASSGESESEAESETSASSASASGYSDVSAAASLNASREDLTPHPSMRFFRRESGDGNVSANGEGTTDREKERSARTPSPLTPGPGDSAQTHAHHVHRRPHGNANGHSAPAPATRVPRSKQVIMRAAYKRYLIATPPPVLVVHLKRFQQTAKTPGPFASFATGFKKLDDFVAFPEHLDLAPYLAPRKEAYGPGIGGGIDGGGKDKEPLRGRGGKGARERCMYRLYAVVVHIGNMLGGHYIAYTALPPSESSDSSNKSASAGSSSDAAGSNSGEMAAQSAASQPKEQKRLWAYISDTSVRLSSLEEVLKSKAYLCMYERI